jgi:hypothetical protein
MHVMIDLETMGVGRQPAIISIGAVAFELDQRVMIDDPNFHVGVSLLSCVMAGLDVEPGTAKFWREQSPEAKVAVMTVQPCLSLGGALDRFSSWLGQHGQTREDGPQLWSNGPTSDMLWLQSAYHAAGLPIPWTHRQPRCYRTIVEAAGLAREERARPVVEHDALEDALAQAKDVISAYRRLER